MTARVGSGRRGLARSTAGLRSYRKRTTLVDILSNPIGESSRSGQPLRVESLQQKSINALTLGGGWWREG
jgi:hypothetical protein